MKLIRLIAVVFIVSGCITIDYEREPPADWPKLEPVYIGHLNCPKPFGTIVFACARPDFSLKRCFIWTDGDQPDWVIKHELAHCEGYDHYADSTFRDYFGKWKSER